ncbi:hypothetical protein B0H11DRAFT_2220142 [Mycena galericulata]|nr:hypothetical protein B0H11DRAFT_2220142 [Mycena galericulata]
MSATDVDEDDLSSTVLLPDPPSPTGHSIPATSDPGSTFSMDSPPAQPLFYIDLEIASVFKPVQSASKRAPKLKKGKHFPDTLSPSTSPVKQARDRKQEERRQALMIRVRCSEDSSLVSGLEALHVSVEPLPVTIVSKKTIPSFELTAAPDAESVIEDNNDDEEDDVFPT